MQLNKKDAKLIKDVIINFKEEKLLSEEKSIELLNNIKIVSFDYKKLSKWSFIFSILCFVVSLTNLHGLIFQYKIFRMSTSIFLSLIFYYFGFRNQNDNKKLWHEFLIFAGVLSTAWFIGEIGTYNIINKSYSLIFFFGAIIYGIISYYGQSKLVLIFSLLSLGTWFGGEIGYISGYASYFLGLSKPLNFLIFGLLLISISYIVSIIKYDKIKFSFNVLLSVGLLYSFLSLWILSLFGNNTYNSIETTKISLLIWSLLFGIGSLLSIFFGLKYDNCVLKGYGITFFLINLYTKYFEYFWDSINKFIFFLILALSFYFIGKKSEDIYLILEKIKK